MLSFQTTTSIAATPQQVWTTLLQTHRWTEWDPALEHVDGELRKGGHLTLRVVDTARPFKLKVTTWEPNSRIVVASGMPFGVFQGTRAYRIAAAGDTTQFTMDEQYSGPLAKLITKSIPDLQPSFDAFASGLRTAAEQ